MNRTAAAVRQFGFDCCRCKGSLTHFTCVLLFVLLFVLFTLVGTTLHAAEKKPLDFSFTFEHPGKLVNIGELRLHVDCKGSGEVTVLLEPGLGGSAFEWVPVQQLLDSRARVCIYDRGGYAWSERSPYPRDASHLAMEAQLLLSQIGADGPLILAGHSFGGFIVRLLADRVATQMLGMVLVDASHEDQLNRLEKINGKTMMPRGNSFVVSQVGIPASLPEELRRKIAAFSRMRKTYAALHAEMTYFRQSAEQVRRARETVDYPVTVVRRGTDLYASDKNGSLKTAIWRELQEDMSTISTSGSLVVATDSGHHVHADQPALIAQVIVDMLDQYQGVTTETER